MLYKFLIFFAVQALWVLCVFALSNCRFQVESRIYRNRKGESTRSMLQRSVTLLTCTGLTS